jgi:hypothetical protein
VAQVPSASTPSQITDNDQRFALAIREPKLKDIDEEELKKAMRYVFMVVGIRGQNIPTGVEKEFLHQYIRTHFGGHTASEIRQAFDMAVQGLLDIDSRDVKCYENFSVMYFSTIMRAYRIWAAEQARRIDTVTPQVMTDEQKKKIDEEYLDYLITVAFQQVQKLDKLPTTLKRLHQWQRESSRTK